MKFLLLVFLLIASVAVTGCVRPTGAGSIAGASDDSSGDPSPVPTPTSSPTPTPEPDPEPTPMPTPTPTPAPTPTPSPTHPCDSHMTVYADPATAYADVSGFSGEVLIKVWGAGGAPDFMCDDETCWSTTGTGGGGAYAEAVVTLVPTDKLTIRVGGANGLRAGVASGGGAALGCADYCGSGNGGASSSVKLNGSFVTEAGGGAGGPAGLPGRAAEAVPSCGTGGNKAGATATNDSAGGGGGGYCGGAIGQGGTSYSIDGVASTQAGSGTNPGNIDDPYRPAGVGLQNANGAVLICY